jgi:uncharacterized repeat protein (TIGR01451 family)
MKRAVVVVAAALVAGVGATAALGDTVTQQPTPWQSPPFTAFSPGLAATDATGNVYVVAGGPSSSFDVAAYNPATNLPLASVGGGTGYVSVVPPAGASIRGIFIQGTNAVLFGRVSEGAFVQSYSLADGTSPGPTTLTQPVGTSFTPTGGASVPGAGGATNFLIAGSDTIAHTPMLVAGTVTNGTVSTSPLCPSYFNSLTNSSPFAPSSVAVNGSGQMLLAGVQIGGLTQLPAVGAVNSGCTALAVSPLAQPGGATNDGFADAISALPDGSFVSASDVSLLNGSSLLFNRLQATGSALPGSSPMQGRVVSNTAVTNVFRLGSGFAGVGAESVSGSPSQGALYRFDASGNLVGGAPTLFGDSNHADTVLQFAQPFTGGVAIGGLGSPLSGPNTLDLFKATTSESPPPCTPVVLSITKTARMTISWGAGPRGGIQFRDLRKDGVAPPGALVQYVVEVSNDGNCDATNVEISDPLPDGFAYKPHASSLTIEAPDGSTVESAMPPELLVGGALQVPIQLLKPHQKISLLIGGKVTRLGKMQNMASVEADGGVSEVSQPAVLNVFPPPPPCEHISLKDSRALIYPLKPKASGPAVAHVDIAVEKDGRHGTCQWVNRKGQLRSVESGCAAIQWLPAKKGKTGWSYRFRTHLRPGHYLVFVRSVGRNGVARTTYTYLDQDLASFSLK